MKLAVVGSRSLMGYHNVMFKELDAIHSKLPITEVISGGAFGPDTYAIIWAKRNNIPYKIFKADWDKHGKAAGMIRNKDIVKACDRLVAFWDGKSTGTKDSLDYAKKTNKLTKTVLIKV